MKKNLFVLVYLLTQINAVIGQPNIIVEAPLNNNSTTQNRAPNGTSAHAYLRACALVLQSELTNIPAGTALTSFGFTLTVGASATPVTGNFTVYLQNTNDVTYQKGTVFATAITGMTSVYTNTMTVPLTPGTTSITVNLSTPFTYTGGGLYVAYDWICTGPYSPTPATYLSESAALNPGCASAASPVSSPTLLTNTNFRPSFLFGAVNTNTNDIQVLGIEAPGRIANSFNTPHTVRAIVKNASNMTQNNIAVNLNVGGANVFSNIQNIPSLNAGATTTVTFAPFNPLLPGANSVSVSVNSDQNNSNNLRVYSQSVTCSEAAQNPATGSYTSNSVGFGTGSGIISWNYFTPALTTTLVGLRGSISTNTAVPGNQTWGVLLNSFGVIVATTNTITLTAGHLGTFQTFNFTSPQNLAPSSQYYFGFAQPANPTAYYPMGTQASSYMPPNLYYTFPLAGGAITPLTQNFGYFGIEALFASTVNVSVSSPTVVCGAPVAITASSTTNYSWSTGATTSSITVTPTITTMYTVVATNTSGCVSSKVSTVTVNPLSLTVTSTPSIVNCGSPVAMLAQGTGNFLWNTGATTASISVTPTTNTSYSVSISNTLGCVNSSVMPILVTPIQVIATGNTPSVCAGNSVSLSASGANFYFWNTPTGTLTGQSFNANPTVSTTYTVVGTTTAGCSSSNVVNIAVFSFTNLTVSASSITVCSGDPINLSANGAISYTWNTPAGPFNNPVITTTLSSNSIYTVTGVDQTGCADSKTVDITVNSVNLSVTGNTAICVSNSIQLSANGAVTYTWNGVIQQQSILVSPPVTTNYSVAGTGTNGCIGNGVVTVSVNPIPSITLTPNRTVMCKGETNSITASGANTYSWNLGGGAGTSVVFSPSVTGNINYSVTGTDNNGCSKTTGLTIKVNACTSIEHFEGSMSHLLVYPNPTERLITVKIENVNPTMTIRVFNLLGELVLEQTNLNEENILNFEALDKGLYSVCLMEGTNKLSISKVIRR